MKNFIKYSFLILLILINIVLYFPYSPRPLTAYEKQILDEFEQTVESATDEFMHSLTGHYSVLLSEFDSAIEQFKESMRERIIDELDGFVPRASNDKYET